MSTGNRRFERRRNPPPSPQQPSSPVSPVGASLQRRLQLNPYLLALRPAAAVGPGANAAAAKDRVIRVFISSTFRDMMRERDLLVKRVFPELRSKCAARRFVTFTEVDLRWGITEEQPAEGQVLPLCLAEIERSRPYFLGLLGERYGWIPDTIPPEVVQREKWLAEHVTGRTSVNGIGNPPRRAQEPRDGRPRLLLPRSGLRERSVAVRRRAPGDGNATSRPRSRSTARREPPGGRKSARRNLPPSSSASAPASCRW